MFRSLVVSAFVLTAAALWVAVERPRPAAARQSPSSAAQTRENYDIRLDRSDEAERLRRSFRGEAPAWSPRTTAAREADAEARFTAAGFQVERSPVVDVPEVISAPAGSSLRLAPASASRVSTLRRFIAENRDLFGIGAIETERLAVTQDAGGRDGSIRVVELSQEIGGVPVFQGSVRGAFDRSGALVRVVNNLAPQAQLAGEMREFGDPAAAVQAAARAIGREISTAELSLRDRGKNVARYSSGHPELEGEVTAERFYFAIEPGIARAAWRVLLWERSDAFYVVVDAATGAMLWRKNITEYQTQPATYNVYGSATSMMRTADSPTPGTPGCSSPNICPQPPIISRTSFTLVGNEPPYTFNNSGWITDGGNTTLGNAVEAGIDRDGMQGVDPNGWAFGSPARSFVYSYNPAPGMPPPGEEPLPPGPQPYPPTAFQQGSVTHAFYTANRWHDETYLLGFNEVSRNFQTDNFGRGGLGGDSLLVEIQDGSGTNGANFATPADGGRGRAQFYIFTGPTPDIDGALDSQTVVHELTHGLSNRLHGNASGLGSNMSRAMGEGWSDFFALALLSEPADDPFGTYSVSCYSTIQLIAGWESNCYYGVRRFPTARRWAVGPNGRSHNPLTFRYLNSDCNTVIGTTTSDPPPTSAFPRGPLGATTCDQVHNMSEVWTAALWELRGFLIDAYGPAEGSRRALRYITDAMKIAPINPTMLQERDAVLIAAELANAGDGRIVWRGFAVRGMGVTASIQNAGTGSNNTAVTESFVSPNAAETAADFDGDGRTDVSVFRPSDGVWYQLRSNGGFAAAAWGSAGDQLVPADYDGDQRTDLAIFRATTDPAQADFYILNSSTSTVSFVSWGGLGDTAVRGDFDGDGRADQAVFRSGENRFWVRQSSNGALLLSRPFADATPVAGDYDGDAKTDFAVYGGGRWSISLSSTSHQSGRGDVWGLATDKLVPGDYDGDLKTDLAVFRPSDSVWYIRGSAGVDRFVQFGVSTDHPVTGDFDGDSRADIAVFRSDGTWYVNRSSAGFFAVQFGMNGDVPLPRP
ncbi:MAG: M36 family metallopeptidase [Pyrinomonadaceae bacterium]